jgi:hypothetical protein
MMYLGVAFISGNHWNELGIPPDYVWLFPLLKSGADADMICNELEFNCSPCP